MLAFTLGWFRLEDRVALQDLSSPQCSVSNKDYFHSPFFNLFLKYEGGSVLAKQTPKILIKGLEFNLLRRNVLFGINNTRPPPPKEIFFLKFVATIQQEPV